MLGIAGARWSEVGANKEKTAALGRAPPRQRCAHHARYRCTGCTAPCEAGTAVPSSEMLRCLPAITERSCGGDGLEAQTRRISLAKRRLLVSCVRGRRDSFNQKRKKDQ